MIDDINIEDYVSEFEQSAAEYGGTKENFKSMLRYEFNPVDIFASPDT